MGKGHSYNVDDLKTRIASCLIACCGFTGLHDIDRWIKPTFTRANAWIDNNKDDIKRLGLEKASKKSMVWFINMLCKKTLLCEIVRKNSNSPYFKIKLVSSKFIQKEIIKEDETYFVVSGNVEFKREQFNDHRVLSDEDENSCDEEE